MILCCGEALIDMIQNAEGAFVPHPGGAVFNTAIGLGRQGVDIGLFSGVSTDLFGDVLTAALAASNVNTKHLLRSERPTTLAFARLVDGKASYVFYDENTAGRMIANTDIPAELPPTIDALFFGGISLAVEPCADTYVALLDRFGANKLVMVDPNIRANFISDESRYLDRISKILNRANLIKISDEDLNWLDRTNRSLEDKAQALLSNTTECVFLTLGEKGVIAFRENGETLKVTPPPTPVVDTVGAGDAFNAGVLTALSRREALAPGQIRRIGKADMEQVLGFAARFAADTVSRAGSDPAWGFETGKVSS